MLLQRTTPFTLTWARLFYMYGEGQAPTRCGRQLQRAAARGDARFPMSGGEQLRDYLPVAEVARMPRRAWRLSARDHGIVNVCSGRPVSVRSLVEGWIATTAGRSSPSSADYPYPDYEPMAFWGDDRKLRRCLNARNERRRMADCEAIYRAEQLPVFQNRMFDSEQAARDSRQGRRGAGAVDCRPAWCSIRPFGPS